MITRYMATSLVSVVLVLVVVAALMPAPTTGKLGLRAGGLHRFACSLLLPSWPPSPNDVIRERPFFGSTV